MQTCANTPTDEHVASLFPCRKRINCSTCSQRRQSPHRLDMNTSYTMWTVTVVFVLLTGKNIDLLFVIDAKGGEYEFLEKGCIFVCDYYLCKDTAELPENPAALGVAKI